MKLIICYPAAGLPICQFSLLPVLQEWFPCKKRKETKTALWIEGCFCFFVYGNPMLGNVYKKIPAISADIKAKEKPGLGLRCEKDSAANACIFIQTKEKSPNANCVQTQSGKR